MKRRLWLALSLAAALATGVLAAACGSSSGGKGTVTGQDGGRDSSVGNNQPDGTVQDGQSPITDSAMTMGNDVVMPGTDTGVVTVTDSGGPVTDSGAGPTDSGGGGLTDGQLAHCSQILGSCDIVSQNCGTGMECIAVDDPDGGPSEITVCSATQPSEHLPSGHTCCPSATNPCEPGLECIGNECSDDAAAPQTGRCSPHCCLGPDGGDDTPCGVSVPEGYPGHCDLQIVDNDNNPLYAVCDYSQNCKPFHIQPCPSGSACEIQDNVGTATCAAIFNPGGDAGGLAAGQACNSGNDCSDGLMCLGPPDGGSTCLVVCYVPGQNAPFDGGSLTSMPPGYGGCPANQNCGSISLFPPWLGICE